MVPRGDATFDDDVLRLWTRALDARAAMVCAVAVLPFVLPAMRDERWWVLGLVAVVFVPYNAVLRVRLTRRRRLDPAMAFADVLLAVACAFAFPATWSAVIAVTVADVAVCVVMFGRRVAIATAVLAGVALSIAGTRIPTDASTGVSGFLVAASILIATVGLVNARENELKRRHAELVNGVEGIVWEFDSRALRFTFMSRQAEHILGWTTEETLDPAMWLERTHPSDQELVSNRVLPGAVSGQRTVDFRIRHAAGHWIWLRDVLTFESDVTGRVTSVRGIAVEVTEQRKADIAVRQYADIIEGIKLSVVVWHLGDTDDDGSLVLIRANPAGSALFRLNEEELLGARLADLIPPGRDDSIIGHIADCARSGVHGALATMPMADGQGGERHVDIRLLPLPGRCVAVLIEDVTAKFQADAMMRHQALHDPLTDLPNRALLQERMANALATSRRTRRPIALLVLDLNQFKEINDTLGHPMGDRMLEQVAGRLSAVLRDCDTVARLGGDEFAVLLTTDADRAGAERVAQRISTALAEPFHLVGIAVQTAASIGIVLSPDHGEDPETLAQRADIAMYNAKRGGRGHAFYSPDDDRTSLRRLSLVGELRRALERDELVLHFQPQISVTSRQVVGMEALVRWNHPEHGLLPPSEFIELAEVSGTIQPLTRWVLRSAVSQAAAFAAAGHPIVMSANVSARNLYDPDLVTALGKDLAAHGLPPDLLMLEITESELVDDPSQVMTVLSLVSDMGVRIAIDDFGTGWSSLANLTRLPIHQIKIDRSFVSRMLDEGDDAVIVRSIVDLGHNLGLAVVAEGVEDEATLAELARLGCDQAQGYLVSRPVPAGDLLAWLTAHVAATATAGVGEPG